MRWSLPKTAFACNPLLDVEGVLGPKLHAKSLKPHLGRLDARAWKREFDLRGFNARAIRREFEARNVDARVPRREFDVQSLNARVSDVEFDHQRVDARAMKREIDPKTVKFPPLSSGIEAHFLKIHRLDLLSPQDAQSSTEGFKRMAFVTDSGLFFLGFTTSKVCRMKNRSRYSVPVEYGQL